MSGPYGSYVNTILAALIVSESILAAVVCMVVELSSHQGYTEPLSVESRILMIVRNWLAGNRRSLHCNILSPLGNKRK